VGLRKKILGKELAGNFVTLVADVSACSVVMIDERSAPSEWTRDGNLKKGVPVGTGCC
jgi:hypothetical protein